MNTQSRPPIVTVLGHVDHGKTTLLDAIRKSNIASREAGGITQSIGASKITTEEGKEITFIDTPGHAAFSKMRSFGAKVADIAILVVSADDGPKPQTIEALEAIKTAGIPFIVAITKTDLQSADPEMVKGALEKEGVLFEGRGGEIPVIAISAKTGTGIKELLGTITLLSEVSGIKGSPDDALESIVIETSKDKKGQLISVVVRDGNIKVGDMIYVGMSGFKVKALFDDKGKSTKVVLPGNAAQILGATTLPPVGQKITREPSSENDAVKDAAQTEVHPGEISIFLKAQTQGSLDALLASMPPGVKVSESGVGDINESDVLLAKGMDSRIFAFESGASSSVLKLAEAESVKIERFKIIYELLLRLEELIKKGGQEILGKAEILAEFPYEGKRVAGCKVLEGKIAKADKFTLKRGETEVGVARAQSMRRGKQDLNEAKPGEEFGVVFDPQLDFKIGDMILSVAK